MMNGRSISSSINRYPFTPIQWQELEHQALIYKYMASGISIPPDLLFIIKRSFLDSPLSSRLLPHHPQHFGWNYMHMGLGRKIDPEPGRCRRTDGKKWRCSKEAYPDSKYCERHMHRGKNRSRKPVEIFKPTPISNTNTNTTYSSTPTSIPSSFITKNITTNSSSALITSSSTTHSLSFLSSSVSSETHHHKHNHHHHHHPQHSSPYGSHLQHHPFLYNNHQPSRTSGICLPLEDKSASAPIFLDPSACSRNKYIYGPKEEVDEHAFFTEPSGTIRSFSTSSKDNSWQLKPLAMSSSSSSKQRSNSYLQLQSLSGHSSSKQLENQGQGCHNNILGSSGSGDTKCEETTLMMKLGKQEPHHQKTVHRFFDEWPHKSRGRGSWLDLDEKSSTTQLSISIPTSAHDFPSFNARTQW